MTFLYVETYAWTSACVAKPTFGASCSWWRPFFLSALSSCKINKHEYLTGEETLPSNQKQTIEQAKFTYYPLGKAFEKQIKTIEDQGEKQV